MIGYTVPSIDALDRAMAFQQAMIDRVERELNHAMQNSWIPSSKSERLTPKQIEWCKANIPAFEDLLK